MRQKSYYTSKEIINNLYTAGAEWQLLNGTEYIGLYHKYTTGEVYTGSTWNPLTSVALTTYTTQPFVKKIYKALKPNIKTAYKLHPNSSQIIISESDRQRGFCFRYFIKKINETTILEIDKQQYDAWVSNNIDTKLYIAVKLTWYISGNIQDIKTGNVISKGVISKNLHELQQADVTVPGMLNKIKNLTEYYSDTDIIVPKDINT